MSKQINLLIKPPLASPGILWGIGLIALTLLGHAIYAGFVFNNVQQAKRALAAVAQEERNTKLIAAQRLASGPGVEELKKEISELNRQSGNLVKKLELSPPGKSDSFAGELTLLAKTRVPNVWLNQITIDGSTGVFAVSGRALSSDSVLAYAAKLNRAFENRNVKFQSVEIKDDVQTPGAKAASLRITSAPPVAFRLN